MKVQKLASGVSITLMLIFLVGMLFSGYMWRTQGDVRGVNDKVINILDNMRQDYKNMEMTNEKLSSYKKEIKEARKELHTSSNLGLKWMGYFALCFVGMFVSMVVSTTVVINNAESRRETK